MVVVYRLKVANYPPSLQVPNPKITMSWIFFFTNLFIVYVFINNYFNKKNE